MSTVVVVLESLLEFRVNDGGPGRSTKSECSNPCTPPILSLAVGLWVVVGNSDNVGRRSMLLLGSADDDDDGDSDDVVGGGICFDTDGKDVGTRVGIRVGGRLVGKRVGISVGGGLVGELVLRIVGLGVVGCWEGLAVGTEVVVGLNVGVLLTGAIVIITGAWVGTDVAMDCCACEEYETLVMDGLAA
jgi:hypothetical protein